MEYKVIEEYAKRGERCDVMKALTLLTKAYVSQCGISLGNRTVVYDAADPWLEKLAWLDLPLSEMARREPFVHLMPHISKEYVPEEYDDYDITAMEYDEYLEVCNQMILCKEFDETTLEVIAWGLLKAIGDKELLAQEIQVITPDGTHLKGILEEQNRCHTCLTMTEPYSGLNAIKYELVRDPRELLLAAYSDYHRLHQLKSEVRSLYPVYLENLKKYPSRRKHCIFEDTYSTILGDIVIRPHKKLIKEWFGLEVY